MFNNSSPRNVGNNNKSPNSNKARKRKRDVKFSDANLESEFEEDVLGEACAIEKKLRTVAKDNSLSDDEMRMLLQKFVKNDHVLALVTLEAENEIARERKEAEQRAILITDTPSIPKLTRAKARELNRTTAKSLSTNGEAAVTEISALIQDDLHSDDEDEEYTFKEDDFMSDDEPTNTSTSDMDSNPRTPQTPLTHTDYEDSPVKLTADGCFKIPLDRNKEKEAEKDLRIATRTRSKFCLEQTTIEDIQSEFVPPDVEHETEHDLTARDVDWMEFLNDFTKPLNASIVGDDDDPINDPEYVAADQVPFDAEELRNVNISKKELADLVAELFEDLVNEGVSLESIELDTPQKFLLNSDTTAVSPGKTASGKRLPAGSTAAVAVDRTQIARNIDFDAQQSAGQAAAQQQPDLLNCVSDSTISSTNVGPYEYGFQPAAMSTPTVEQRTTIVRIARPSLGIDDTAILSPKTCAIPTLAVLGVEPQLIAIPLPGQPKCYQLAKVVSAGGDGGGAVGIFASPQPRHDTRYSLPYDSNFTCEYISIKKHIYSEYAEQFENLRHLPAPPMTAATEKHDTNRGFTEQQAALLQQQLRIHVQFVVQNFVQSYSHPEYWQLAPRAKDMLSELERKAITHAPFRASNLAEAVDLVAQWEADLLPDTANNKAMMDFIHTEIQHTNRNTRQIARFPPRIMDLILNSTVFLYPRYLPRIPFISKVSKCASFSPAESQLIALGLEKHRAHIDDSRQRKSKESVPLMVACGRLAKDTVFGKSKRRIWDHIKCMREDVFYSISYNPIKYYFDNGRAPPVQHEWFPFEPGVALAPKERCSELPLVWQKHVEATNVAAAADTRPAGASEEARISYLRFVQDAVGCTEIGNSTLTAGDSTIITDGGSGGTRKRHRKKAATAVTINVNYVFGGGISPNTSTAAELLNITASGPSNTTSSTPERAAEPLDRCADVDRPITPIAYHYDCNTQSLCPVLPPTNAAALNANATRPASLIALRWKAGKPKNSRRPWRRRLAAVQRARRSAALLNRAKVKLSRRCRDLVISYRLILDAEQQTYASVPLLQRCYANCRALERYTELLDELKMFCRTAVTTPTSPSSSSSPANASNSILGKRSRPLINAFAEDEAGVVGRSRKVSRQEENLRHMLAPDMPEDANRKDAIYAFNFYEKVEEALKLSNRPDACAQFNRILTEFDPTRDRTADLYFKMEQLFLPDHPDLAQVFLSFLLPSEAAAIGKFFEHFMVTNVTTFVNKLNVYFNKQPAQIRKIYTCLNELADEADVSIKKIQTKILPLLKGNTVLTDWFMQQFDEAPPPERLLPPPEYVNLKEVQNHQSGECHETVMALLDSPTAPVPEQPAGCQLKYINGRIFYGLKMTLPAKLSFMAANSSPVALPVPPWDQTPTTAALDGGCCVHGIREHGEQRLSAAAAHSAAAAAAIDGSGTDEHSDNGKADEEDADRVLIIDNGAGNGGCEALDDDSDSASLDPCDEATLRGHASRLNPSFYGHSCYNQHATAASSVGGGMQTAASGGQAFPHGSSPSAGTVKRSALHFPDDAKISPRKQLAATCLSPSQQAASVAAAAGTLPATTMSGAQLREKRKSPKKQNRSPVAPKASVGRLPAAHHHPMVVIHERTTSPAIAYAKKLKSYIETAASSSNSNNSCNHDDEDDAPELYRKEHIGIVARPKQDVCSAEDAVLVPKLEDSDELEFLPETDGDGAAITLMQLESLCTTEGALNDTPPSPQQQQPEISSTHADIEDEYKLDIVASLATSRATPNVSATESVAASNSRDNATAAATAWTRSEDKIFLLEMNRGVEKQLFVRVRNKLPARTIEEISARHQFLMDFLSKLQGK